MGAHHYRDSNPGSSSCEPSIILLTYLLDSDNARVYDQGIWVKLLLMKYKERSSWSIWRASIGHWLIFRMIHGFPLKLILYGWTSFVYPMVRIRWGTAHSDV